MRLIVYVHGMDNCFVNIEADRVERDDVFVTAYRNNQVVGMFDIGSVMMLYLSEKCPTEKR